VTFEHFDVVRVPFPFTDRTASKNRPAVVLSDAALFNVPTGHAVMAMITSAKNPPWSCDCVISDIESAGLPAPSKVRCKLFTLDVRLVREVVGRLSRSDAERVRETLRQVILGVLPMV
jgi:mRNA interferase MazF